ncbi:aa3-type cytochrome oxidase subunit II [Nocardioides acrostichi]|uniref:cytochrome-c oxidase n=1 Tax=Nocardioides acrostichi TaxID=2784339 RepID=A0A930UWU8_9ACTN|nr:cytochrome c oxidase subunit II [Nocardioides acrostichi]MBF4160540.1 cytochrome c oxidase subunit II [Nocardioides acrostichi]
MRASGTRRNPAARLGRAAVLAAGVLLLAGCSSQSKGEWERLAMPEPATKQGESTLALWQGAWIAALVTGVIVWGLIAYAVIRFRRRSDDEIPVQTRYNMPLEIFYTIAPIMMVVVFFVHTVRVQNIALDEEPTPDNIIEVTGQQWAWTFNYGLGTMDASADDDKTDDNFAYQHYTYEVGTAGYIPTLVLPVGETTRFNLHSPDVIHDFGVPAFLMKMDVVPGRVNSYQLTPTKEGDYEGKCYELCGLYHSRMLFHVKVVSPQEYEDYVQSLVTRDGDSGDERESDKPLLGSSEASSQYGLETSTEGESE